MDLLAKARKLESHLARTVDRAAQQWSKSGPRGPLEVVHGILDAVDERIEPAGRGTHVFPFNKVKATIVAVLARCTRPVRRSAGWKPDAAGAHRREAARRRL